VPLRTTGRSSEGKALQASTTSTGNGLLLNR
jgi:hypothetical protein